jgi:hypothetical protein
MRQMERRFVKPVRDSAFNYNLLLPHQLRYPGQFTFPPRGLCKSKRVAQGLAGTYFFVTSISSGDEAGLAISMRVTLPNGSSGKTFAGPSVR